MELVFLTQIKVASQCNLSLALKTRSVLIRYHSDNFRSIEISSLVSSPSDSLYARCATNKYFQILGNIHDIESYFGIDNMVSLNVQIFFSHWGHLAIILVWVSSNLFHIGWTGNYELWQQNPIKTIPIAHSIFDPHFGLSKIENNIAYNGLYNILYTLGFNSTADLYNFLILSEYLAVISIPLAFIHLIFLDSYLQSGQVAATQKGLPFTNSREIEFHLQIIIADALFIWPFKLFTAYFDLSKERLNFHIGTLIGFSSIAWSGHIVHHALPISRGIQPYLLSSIQLYLKILAFYKGCLSSLGLDMDKDNHIQRSTYGAGESLLTFFGGLKSNTISLYLTDIAHHHLALGILLVLSTHLYSSLYKGFGHRIGDVFFLNGNSSSMITACHKSLHLALSLGCSGLSLITSVVAQDTYSLLPFVYLSYITTVALKFLIHILAFS